MNTYLPPALVINVEVSDEGNNGAKNISSFDFTDNIAFPSKDQSVKLSKFNAKSLLSPLEGKDIKNRNSEGEK